jgi:hypothetical protein
LLRGLQAFAANEVGDRLLVAGLACLREPDPAKWAALPEMAEPFDEGVFTVQRFGEAFLLTSSFPMLNGRRRCDALFGTPPVELVEKAPVQGHGGMPMLPGPPPGFGPVPHPPPVPATPPEPEFEPDETEVF